MARARLAVAAVGAWCVGTDRVRVRVRVRRRVNVKVTWRVGAFGVCMALVELVVSALVNVCALDAIATEPSLTVALVGACNGRVGVRVGAIAMGRVMVMVRLTATWSVGTCGVCMALMH